MSESTNSHVHNCSGPVSRRNFLEFGAVAGTGAGLADLLRAREAAASGNHSPQDTAVIFVWLAGGPPHMETYDMKPDAPRDYRGEFSPIETNVPGIDVCELLPMHTQVADRFNIIRSIRHDFSDHGGGHKRFMTGRDPLTPTGFVNDKPCVGSMASLALKGGRDTRGLPNYIVLGSNRVDSVDTFSFGSAYLGAHTHPFRISADPSRADFAVQNVGVDKSMSDRLEDRVALLNGFDGMRRELDNVSMRHSMDVFNQRAVAMLTSPDVRSAFDIAQEAPEVRERFGRHGWGQRAILARRLVERGVPWVTVVMENPYQSGVLMPKYGTYNWDSHAVNCHLFKDAEIRFPIYDRTVTAMIEDLYDRGLDRKVLLVVTGEFGRTPRITVRPGSQTKVNQPGRDHWPAAMSVLVSGGGMRTGQIIGATNSRGEEPIRRAMTPNDLWATVFRHLGVDYTSTFPDYSGRPMHILPYGEPIAELT
jgi:hypothetical protein